MLFTTHLLVGAAIGKTAGNPAIGFLIGYISHHILDYIPHYDQGSSLGKEEKELNWNKRAYLLVLLDVLIGLSVLTVVLLNNNSQTINILAGCWGAILPDLIDNAPIVKERFRQTKFGRKFHKFHEGMHQTLPANNWLIGLIAQIVLAGIMLRYIT